MSEWRWLGFSKPEHHVTMHAARGVVRDAVVAEMAFRDCTLAEDEDLPELFIDEPGMVCTTRPIEEFDFFGLRLSIPSEDVAMFILQLEGLQENGKKRTINEVSFYKVHAWMRILCLSEHEHGNLLVLLRSRVARAEQRSAEFYATRKLPSEVLREANGTDLNCGANKCDRFKLKSGGKA